MDSWEKKGYKGKVEDKPEKYAKEWFWPALGSDIIHCKRKGQRLLIKKALRHLFKKVKY